MGKTVLLIKDEKVSGRVKLFFRGMAGWQRKAAIGEDRMKITWQFLDKTSHKT